MWEGGSLGTGDLDGTAVIAYVSDSTTGPADPSDIGSSFQEHDFFGFFGMDLSQAHSDSYSSYISGSGSGSGPSAPSSTASTPPSSTSSAPAPGQTVSGVRIWYFCRIVDAQLTVCPSVCLVRPGNVWV